MDRKRFNVILAIVAITALGAYLYLRPDLSFTDSHPVLERGLEYRAEDLIEGSKGKVYVDSEYLDTDDVGEKRFVYHLSRGLLKRDVILNYTVQDTTAPRITIHEKNISVDYKDGYDKEDMRSNVSVDEGDFIIETRYDRGIPGTYDVDVIASDGYGNASRDSFKVTLIDSDPPLVFSDGDGTVVMRGKKFDILNVISYGDNTDPSPKLEIEGRVLTARVGKYPLHARLTDRSGNSTEWDLTVEVRLKLPKEEEDDYRLPFAEFAEKWKNDSTRVGIDVSEWQDEIDFEAVKKAGCEFVFMRIGFSYKGVMKTDKEFERNYENAVKAGLPVGIYLFCYDDNEEELLASLHTMFEVLGDRALDLPIVFDWEDFYDYPEYEMSFHELKHLYDVFEREVESHGYESMLYGSKYYLNSVWTDAVRKPVWLAQYYVKPTYEGPYEFWQHASYGQIDGIDGPVDLDVWFLKQ